MTIKEIVGEQASENVVQTIAILQNRNTASPDLQELKKEFDPCEDPVFDPSKRPDKNIYDDPTDPNKLTRIELVNRLALSLPKIIVERAVAFLFGNEVKIDGEWVNDTQKNVVAAVKKVLSDNYGFALNRKVAREVFKNTEAAEYWYTVEAPDGFDSYGFTSKRKLRHTIFSAKNGDKLFPLFDSTGDMVAFSRRYEIKQPNGRTIEYFETYTSEEKQVWMRNSVGASVISVPDGTNLSGSWEALTPEINPIGRIPIVYASQEQSEVHDVVSLIRRLNKLLSNFAETNDYFSSPKLFFIGELVGMPRRSDGGQILQGKQGSSAQYLSWDQAPESVKLEITTLIEQIYALTQTPNISFENVKGIDDISGVALKLLFLDAHLKVKNKEEIFVPYLQRRHRIIAAYLGEMNNSWKREANKMTMTPVITPYMIDDLLSEINTYVAGTGGKAIISQKRAINLLGLTDNEDAEYEQIQKESQADVFEPTV